MSLMIDYERLKSDYEINGSVNIPKRICEETFKLDFELKEIINKFFHNTDIWKSFSSDDYYSYCYDCQEKINQIDYQTRFLNINKESLIKISSMKNIWHESLVFLRAIRPKKLLNKTENIGFHRETMYTDSPVQTSKCHNIWIPISKVTSETAVQFYPKSQKIPDSELYWEDDKLAYRIQKGSKAHGMGMFYKPKKIIKGLENLKYRPMMPNKNEFTLFSAMTIHGAGVNNSDSIRLSLSMATIESDEIKDNKPYLAAKGKSHYKALSSHN